MIKPVVMQGIIQRTQDISQIKQNVDNKHSLDQANIQAQFHKELVMEHKQVIKKDNASYHKDNYDAKDKGNGEYNDNQGKKQKEENNKDGKVIVKKKGGFDVKI